MKKWNIFILLLWLTNVYVFSQPDKIVLKPLVVNTLIRPQLFERTIYSIQNSFTNQDTLYFLNKINKINILRIDSVSIHELSCTILIDSGFVDFARHGLVLMDQRSNPKIYLDLDVRYGKPPVIESQIIRQDSKVYTDTLHLSRTDYTLAELTLRGKGFFESTDIEFDDPSIKTLNDPGWRTVIPPDLIRVGLEIKNSSASIGPKQYRINNNFALENFGNIFLKSPAPPQIFSKPPVLTADGLEKRVQISGKNFHKNLKVKLLPGDEIVKVKYNSDEQLELFVNIPVQENDKSYRIAIINPDAQADTSDYFTVKAKPLSPARINSVSGKSIFINKESHVIITITPQNNLKFDKTKSYEINIGTQKYPVTFVIDDTTCEAVVTLKGNSPLAMLNRHIFTINEVNAPPKWKGLVFSQPAPVVNFSSAYKILHPVDTLQLVFKGENLDNAVVFIKEPEVSFQITENRGDLIRVRVVAGENVSCAEYPLLIKKDNVTFEFDKHQISIKPWKKFTDYTSVHVKSIGALPANSLWQDTAKVHIIEKNDAVRLDFDTKGITEKSGEQKVIITAVLIDSSYSIKSQVMAYKTIMNSDQNKTVNWHWRIRERLHSGDRIEITLQNPGGLNKVTEVFYVKPHWSESFRGSTSFILLKLPFNGHKASAEILRTMGIGISYQVSKNSNFLALDGSFLIGNVASENSDLSVEVGLGMSAILWQHVQMGVGSNITGKSFSETFIFLGTRIKLPVPWL
ncbi:hypothetical protein JXQ31_03965 [candidate division KSB1 bacterium]|nr:hypothetical protein [candidate division KSB1 bacterium]